MVDIIEVLTDSVNPKQYIKKLRSRDNELNINWGTICTTLEMTAKDEKKEKYIVPTQKLYIKQRGIQKLVLKSEYEGLLFVKNC